MSTGAKVIPTEVEAVAMPMPMPMPMPATGVSIASPQHPMVVNSSGLFDSHPAIQTMSGTSINIMHRAQFDRYCYVEYCVPGNQKCCQIRSREYFYVLENAIESNRTIGLSICCVTSQDLVSKTYFDRGIFDQQGCYRSMGCSRGTPMVYANNVTFVCCCMECGSGMNQCLECYFPSICGERVRYVNAETVNCCCPTRSCWLYNFCGLCGVKSGDPMPSCSGLVTMQLKPGAAAPLASAIESARSQWSARTNLP